MRTRLWQRVCSAMAYWSGGVHKYLEVCILRKLLMGGGGEGRNRGLSFFKKNVSWWYTVFAGLTCAWCLFHAEARVWPVGWRWPGGGSLWHGDLGGRAPCGVRTCNNSRLWLIKKDDGGQLNGKGRLNVTLVKKYTCGHLQQRTQTGKEIHQHRFN